MHTSLMLCIPGPWVDRKDFLIRIVQETKGKYMFAGKILAQPSQSRHVGLDFYERDAELKEAFEIAGQGKLSQSFLSEVDEHQSIAYLRFEKSFIEEQQKIIDFTRVMQRVGGIGVKVESSGAAYEWQIWFELIASDNPFDWYRTLVVLVGDDQFYYSCGMHLFGLPDVEVPRHLDIGAAAELMNRFNYWQIAERPTIGAGHTFSLTLEAPHFHLQRFADSRHATENLFNNPSGLWRLSEAGPSSLH